METGAASESRFSYRRAVPVAVLVLSLLTTARLIFRYTQKGEALSFREAILSGFATWVPWLGLSWLVLVAARRFPFEPPHLKRAIAAHALIVVIVVFLFGAARWAFSYSPLIDQMPLGFIDVTSAHVHLVVLAYAVLVGTEQARQNWRRFQERAVRAALLETRLAQAQLAALQTQLQPHFLFNVLNAISTLMHRDPDAAEELICLLAELLRVNLKVIGQATTPVSQELHGLQLYVELQRRRFAERFTYEITPDPGTLDRLVPTHLLQPLADDLIRQRVEVTSDAWQLQIAVHVSHDHDEMLHCVVDLHPNALRTPANAIALPWDDQVIERTRARLDALFGAHARLDLAFEQAGRVSVTVALPARVHK